MLLTEPAVTWGTAAALHLRHQHNCFLMFGFDPHTDFQSVCSSHRFTAVQVQSQNRSCVRDGHENRHLDVLWHNNVKMISWCDCKRAHSCVPATLLKPKQTERRPGQTFSRTHPFCFSVSRTKRSHSGEINFHRMSIRSWSNTFY